MFFTQPQSNPDGQPWSEEPSRQEDGGDTERRELIRNSQQLPASVHEQTNNNLAPTDQQPDPNMEHNQQGSQAPPDQQQQPQSKPICRFYKQGTCRFGIAGRGCPHDHPPPCRKLIKHGNRGPNGCTLGRSCDKFHPKCVPPLWVKGNALNQTANWGIFQVPRGRKQRLIRNLPIRWPIIPIHRTRTQIIFRHDASHGGQNPEHPGTDILIAHSSPTHGPRTSVSPVTGHRHSTCADATSTPTAQSHLPLLAHSKSQLASSKSQLASSKPQLASSKPQPASSKPTRTSSHRVAPSSRDPRRNQPTDGLDANAPEQLTLFTLFNIHGLKPRTVPTKVPFLQDLLQHSKQIFVALT